jgi:hypothetical protein
VIARDAQGRRSRARRAWPVDAAAARPLELRLQPERELFRVRLVDSLGAAIPANAVSIHAASPDSEHLAHLLHGKAAHRDAPYVERGAENELGVWGWPVEVDWKFSASYIYHGPTSAPVVCACGTREVELVLPATGHAQLRTKLPRPFPNDALQAVYRHVASGSVARWMVLDGATNHRLLVGQHALSLELGGEPWLDLGLVEVPHGNTRELPIELPSALRSFKLFVQDAEDRELPAARVRRIHCGTPHGFHRDGGPPWGVLVATTEAKLDLQVECEGFEAERLFGVEGERVVVLRRIPR